MLNKELLWLPFSLGPPLLLGWIHLCLSHSHHLSLFAEHTLKVWECARQKWGCCHPMLYSSVIIQPPVLELGGPSHTLPAVHCLLGVVFVWLHNALSVFFALWFYTVLSVYTAIFSPNLHVYEEAAFSLSVNWTSKKLENHSNRWLQWLSSVFCWLIMSENCVCRFANSPWCLDWVWAANLMCIHMVTKQSINHILKKKKLAWLFIY